MSRLFHISFAVIVLGLLIFSVVTATSGDFTSDSTDDQKFQELLESVEPTALHEILHEHLKEKFKHGVYQEDKTAMEVVHQQNAEVARNLVELARRQVAPASNGTVTTTTTTASTETTSEELTTPSPNPTSTSDETVSTTSSPSESSSASTTSTTSSTDASSSTSTSTTTLQTSSSESSNLAPQTTSRATLASAPTSGAPSDSSNLDHGSLTQSIIYSTTLAGGIQSIVTQITVVPADQAASQTDGGKPTNSNTASARLQPNSASLSSRNLSLGVFLGSLNLLSAWLS